MTALGHQEVQKRKILCLCSQPTKSSQQISTLFIPFYRGRLDRHNTPLSRAMLHIARYHRRVLVLILNSVLRVSLTRALQIVLCYQRCRKTSYTSHHIASKSERVTHTILWRPSFTNLIWSSYVEQPWSSDFGIRSFSSYPIIVVFHCAIP